MAARAGGRGPGGWVAPEAPAKAWPQSRWISPSRPGVPRHPAPRTALRGPPWKVSLGKRQGLGVSSPGSLLCSQASLGSRGLGKGAGSGLCLPLMPRPGAQIPASGGGRETPGPSTRPGPRLLRRAGQPKRERERGVRSGRRPALGAPPWDSRPPAPPRSYPGVRAPNSSCL